MRANGFSEYVELKNDSDVVIYLHVSLLLLCTGIFFQLYTNFNNT